MSHLHWAYLVGTAGRHPANLILVKEPLVTTAIDSHVHFWNVSQNDWYPALKPFAEAVGSDTINTNFFPGDYRKSSAGLDVKAFVHISATTAPGAYLQEGPWIDSLATEHGLDLVMIGTIDPESQPERIVADLDAQASSARFRGARVFPGIEPDAPAAKTLLEWLNGNGMIFDLVTGPASAAAWAEVLTRYPDLRVAIEHTGSPNPSEDGAFDAWKAAMQTLAARPGTMCKLTGLGMVTMTLAAEPLKPWIDETFEIFGADRVMFGSNMPIETMAGTYAQWIETLGAVLASASEEERTKFYEHNARFYWA